jgi:hypothetical protein
MQIAPIAIASDSVADVPKRPPLRMHCFRCPEDLWERGKAAAEFNDETLTEALQRMLTNYAKAAERAEKRRAEQEEES